MGGGGSQAVPAPAQPLDLKKIMRAGNEMARATVDQQFKDQIKYYPQMEGQALGTVGKISAGLNNDFTAQAKGIIDQTLQQGATQLSDTGNRINTLGDQSSAMSAQAQQRALAGATSIEQGLYDRAASDLALGSQLSPEEERMASQQANAAWSSRGLGTGASAGAADLLNRYQYGQARLQQRLGNAQAANQTMEQGIQGRQNTAQGLLGNTANIYGQAGGAYQNAASLGFGGANALINLDPYQRSLGYGIQLGSGIQGNNGQMIGNAYNNSQQMAGNVASFNANLLDTRYNSALNNNAAMSGANSAANGQLMGAGIGAIGTIGSGAAMGYMMGAGGIAI
jgi:hypothetical protein